MTYDQYLHQETEKHYKAIGLDTDEPIPECGYCGAEDYREKSEIVCRCYAILYERDEA